MCVYLHTHFYYTGMHLCTHTYTHTMLSFFMFTKKSGCLKNPQPPSNSVIFACLIPSEEGISWEAWKESPETLLIHIKLVIQCMTRPHNGVADTSNRGHPSLPPWLGSWRAELWAQVQQGVKPERPGKHPEWQSQSPVVRGSILFTVKPLPLIEQISFDHCLLSMWRGGWESLCYLS